MRSALSDYGPLKLRNRRSKGLFNPPWQEALQPLAQSFLSARDLNLVELGFWTGLVFVPVCGVFLRGLTAIDPIAARHCSRILAA